MAKKQEQQPVPIGTNQNEQMLQAFTLITNDGLQTLRVFENAKYRTVATIDHSDNDKYPNLIRESISFFWNLTLSRNSIGNLILYFTYDKDAAAKFGTMIFNNMLRSIFKHTTALAGSLSIENDVRVNVNTKDINYFFNNRLIEGEKVGVLIQAMEYVPT
jgi:hypothetical protein